MANILFLESSNIVNRLFVCLFNSKIFYESEVTNIPSRGKIRYWTRLSFPSAAAYVAMPMIFGGKKYLFTRPKQNKCDSEF